MICQETGYDDVRDCACVPCDKCVGEGHVGPLDIRCPACLGTGRDSSACEIDHEKEGKDATKA